jgi:hypothetical protein
MLKKLLISTIAVFVAWAVLDFVIHQLILGSAYERTAHLWRPMAEMKMGAMYLTVFLTALAFSYLYISLVGEKSLNSGLKFGLIFGAAIGLGMGFGTFSVQPIPYSMAQVWFWGRVVEGAVGGVILGLLNKA